MRNSDQAQRDETSDNSESHGPLPTKKIHIHDVSHPNFPSISTNNLITTMQSQSHPGLAIFNQTFGDMNTQNQLFRVAENSSNAALVLNKNFVAVGNVESNAFFCILLILF